PPKRVRFPVVRLWRRCPRRGFLVQLSGNEIAKMRSKQIFKLLQVLIIMAAVDKFWSTALFPSRKKLLHRVPLPAENVSFSVRLEGCKGGCSIPVNVQCGRSGSLL